MTTGYVENGCVLLETTSQLVMCRFVTPKGIYIIEHNYTAEIHVKEE